MIGHNVAGVIHILLIIAIIAVLVRVFQGRKILKANQDHCKERINYQFRFAQELKFMK